MSVACSPSRVGAAWRTCVCQTRKPSISVQHPFWEGKPLPAFPNSGSSLQQAAHTQEALEEAVQMMKEAVEDLTTTLNEAASAAGVVGGMVESCC